VKIEKLIMKMMLFLRNINSF